MLILDNSKNELITKNGFIPWLISIPTLSRKLIADKIDYLLIGQILPLGTAAYLVSLFQPTKYAVFLHGMDFALAIKTMRKRFLSKLILKKADKIICANGYVKEKLLEFLPNIDTKIIVINPGIEGGEPYVDQNILNDIKNKYNFNSKTILLSLGRLVKRKGVDVTIESLIHLPQSELDNLLYFIAGAGPREEYLKQLVTPILKDKVIFLGSLSEDEKWAWLKLCNIFIMPSRDIEGDFEGFGIVYLEANLCGKAVIAGNSGGVRDAVVNEVSGLMVDPEKPDEIANTISRLINNPELRNKLGEQGKKRALEEFNWEKQALKIYQFIK